MGKLISTKLKDRFLMTLQSFMNINRILLLSSILAHKLLSKDTKKMIVRRPDFICAKPP